MQGLFQLREAVAKYTSKKKNYEYNSDNVIIGPGSKELMFLLHVIFDGEIKNKSKARLIRDGVEVYEGEILSIFREKNAVKEVKNGLECGISLKDFIDFKEKDIIESYFIEKIERTI